MSRSYMPVRTLMIVEDDDDLRAYLGQHVRDLGYQVVEAANGRAAYELLTASETGAVHAVLCDINMPEMGGVALLKKLRSGGNSLPFAFLTGFQNEEQLLTALRLGANDFLRKPFEMEQVHDVVARILDQGVRLKGAADTVVELASRIPDAAATIESVEREQMHVRRLQAVAAGGRNRR